MPGHGHAGGDDANTRPGSATTGDTAMPSPNCRCSTKGADGDSAAAAGLLFTATLVYVLVVLISVGHMIAARREKHSGGQLPPRPAQFGRALEDERDGGPGNDLMPCHAYGDTRARRLPGQCVIQRIWRSVPTRRVSAGQCT
jgi:hypothetical protein